MDLQAKEYFYVFETILLGIGVTQLLIGWGKLISKRDKIKFYWAHIIITIVFLLMIVQRVYVRQDLGQFDFINNSLSFLIFIVVPPSIVLFIIYIFLPDNSEEVDFKEVIIKNRWLFTAGAISLMGIANLTTYIKEGWQNFMWINMLIAATVILFAITKKLRLFEIIAAGGFVFILILMFYR